MSDVGPRDDVLLSAVELDEIVNLWHRGLALLEMTADPGTGVLRGLRAACLGNTPATNSIVAIERDLAQARSLFLEAMQPLLDARDRP